jgi:hypothetical protein
MWPLFFVYSSRRLSIATRLEQVPFIETSRRYCLLNLYCLGLNIKTSVAKEHDDLHLKTILMLIHEHTGRLVWMV